MRLVVATYGTEGDTRPLAALCRALMDAGHEATLLADRSTLSVAQALGVPTSPLSGDIKGSVDPAAAISSVVGKNQGLGNMADALAGIANANAQAWLREIVAAAEGCDAIVASALAAFVGLSAAEHLGVKAIGTGCIPLTPTSTFAHPFLPPQRVPRIFNRLSFSVVTGLLWHAFRTATNRARASVCALPPRRENWTTHPMLYGVSPSLLPPPHDWPDHARVCGQWIPSGREWAPPGTLSTFLSAGEAPLYVGFGSMVGFDRKRLLKAVILALEGRRTLFYPGWAGSEGLALPGNLFVLGDTPHDWLFPQVSAVIHHGGSGTSHSAARAGVPSVVVPFAGDQWFWAERLRQAGIADEAVGAHKLQASSLAHAILFTERADVAARAREVGERMRQEDGLTIAVKAIEELLSA